ncbi:helix-turn-helix domain-containing protein [Paeniglutamicibacter antarcticus]|uniref:Helix-turn-helix domain-containing protein n=1 Tax=Arthrobacter terrae TaxID=2935737 RepID=A0A931CR41_9MICC|nr:helix-turn-helix domain-containing protein [Arthrobacter terrae]MBG0739464.1 helix-turn-helix domain-containing protein [Arthrobacter terrae]
MQEPDQEARLMAVAALGDPVRRTLYELLRRSPEAMSRDQLAGSAGIPRSTAAVQLERLVASGLLSTENRKRGGRSGPGSGRPAKLYRTVRPEVAVSVPERSYDLAARLMAAAIEKSSADGSPVRDVLAQVAFEAGNELGSAAGTIDGMLTQTGYSPEPDGQGGYLLGNCPFHRLAHRHRDVVCGLNAALLTGALSGCADEIHQVLPDPDGPYCCARITCSPTAGVPAAPRPQS